MRGDIKNQLPQPVKIKLEDNVEINGEMVEYCLKQNRDNDKRYKVLDEYFNNETAIQKRMMEDGDKPNNKISHSFAKYITKIATAFFVGHGVKYETEDKAYKAALDGVIDSNMTKIRHFEEAKAMGKKGISYELLYINPEGKLKTQHFDAGEMIPVFSQSLGNFLAMVLRLYKVEPMDRRRKVEEYVDVYTSKYIYTLKKDGNKNWRQIDMFSHNFSDVPVIIRFNNAELKGDYEDIIPQIDAYEKAVSDTANDLDYFTDAYLVLEGIDDLTGEDEDGNEISTEESAKLLKKNRMLYLPTGGKGYFITKDANDNVSENHKNRCFKDIFFLSQVPNLTDEEFSGNLSGVAIRYKLFGLEELAIEKQAYFVSSETKKVRLITEYLNKLHNTQYDWKSVKLSLDRSVIANNYEMAEIIAMLRGILSDETLIGLYPEVENASEELTKRNQERRAEENTGEGNEDDSGNLEVP